MTFYYVVAVRDCRDGRAAIQNTCLSISKRHLSIEVGTRGSAPASRTPLRRARGGARPALRRRCRPHWLRWRVAGLRGLPRAQRGPRVLARQPRILTTPSRAARRAPALARSRRGRSRASRRRRRARGVVLAAGAPPGLRTTERVGARASLARVEATPAASSGDARRRSDSGTRMPRDSSGGTYRRLASSQLRGMYSLSASAEFRAAEAVRRETLRGGSDAAPSDKGAEGFILIPTEAPKRGDPSGASASVPRFSNADPRFGSRRD